MSEAYFVIFHEDAVWEDGKWKKGKLHIKNRTFSTFMEARDYTKGVHPSREPRILQLVEEVE